MGRAGYWSSAISDGSASQISAAESSAVPRRRPARTPQWSYLADLYVGQHPRTHPDTGCGSATRWLIHSPTARPYASRRRWESR